MLSNSFWYGFLMGAGLVLLIAYVFNLMYGGKLRGEK
jgi:hypothetical protein